MSVGASASSRSGSAITSIVETGVENWSSSRSTTGPMWLHPTTRKRCGRAGGSGVRSGGTTPSSAKPVNTMVSSSSETATTSSPGPNTVSIGGWTAIAPSAARRPMTVDASNARSASPNVCPVSSGTVWK